MFVTNIISNFKDLPVPVELIQDITRFNGSSTETICVKIGDYFIREENGKNSIIRFATRRIKKLSDLKENDGTVIIFGTMYRTVLDIHSQFEYRNVIIEDGLKIFKKIKNSKHKDSFIYNNDVKITVFEDSDDTIRVIMKKIN
jgi:hypothetical protein